MIRSCFRSLRKRGGAQFAIASAAVLAARLLIPASAMADEPVSNES